MRADIDNPLIWQVRGVFSISSRCWLGRGLSMPFMSLAGAPLRTSVAF
jgi:hypothetical protein